MERQEVPMEYDQEYYYPEEYDESYYPYEMPADVSPQLLPWWGGFGFPWWGRGFGFGFGFPWWWI